MSSNLFATTVTATSTFQNLGTLLGAAGLTLSSDSVTSVVSYIKNNSTTINLYIGTGTAASTTNYATVTPLSAVQIVAGTNVNQVWIASASSTVATDFVEGGVAYIPASITGVIGTITGTANTVPKYSSGNLVDSAIVDNGTTVAISEPVTSTGSIKSSSATGGIGYATGAGGAQTQATDKSTTVVSNTVTTAITMNNASLAASTTVSFTFTNSAIAATDQVIVTHQSAGTSAAYNCNAFPGAGSAVISVRNVTLGALAEAIVLRVSIYKAVSA